MKYANILINLIKASVSTTLMYRANLYGSIVSTILWAILSLTSISVLTYQVAEVGGWSRYQLFVVQGVYSVILGTMYFIFGDNLKRLSRQINRGDLDLWLTKPVDSQFIVSVGEYKLYQLARVATGVIILIYALSVLHIVPSFLTILLFVIFVVASSTIIYSIWFILTTLSIWLISLFNLHDLFIHITGLTRYPLEIFKYLSKYLLYVTLPLVVITTVPAQILLQKFNLPLAVAAIALAVIFFTAARKFWFFALKYYTSASS